MIVMLFMNEMEIGKKYYDEDNQQFTLISKIVRYIGNYPQPVKYILMFDNGICKTLEHESYTIIYKFIFKFGK